MTDRYIDDNGNEVTTYDIFKEVLSEESEKADRKEELLAEDMDNIYNG